MSDSKTQTAGSEAQNADKVKKKISLVKILVLLVIMLVVFGGAAAGVLYFLYGPESADTNGDTKTQPSESEEGEPSQAQEDTKVVGTSELKPFIVNLADSGSYLKITIALGIGAVEHGQLLDSKAMQVRDAILTVLPSKSSNTLSTKHGQMNLKEDIKKALGKLSDLKNVVTSVYFTDFQIL